jgi:uncharacterized protein YjbJ (UPF0337 family)
MLRAITYYLITECLRSMRVAPDRKRAEVSAAEPKVVRAARRGPGSKGKSIDLRQRFGTMPPGIGSCQYNLLEEIQMGSASDKISGVANQAAGKAKQGVGNLTGDEKLKAEGAAQETKGKVEKTVGDVKSAVKDAANKNL